MAALNVKSMSLSEALEPVKASLSIETCIEKPAVWPGCKRLALAFVSATPPVVAFVIRSCNVTFWGTPPLYGESIRWTFVRSILSGFVMALLSAEFDC